MQPTTIRLPAVFIRSLLQAAAVHSLPIAATLKALPYEYLTSSNDSTVELSALFELADALVTSAPFDTTLPLVKVISYEQIDELMTLMVTGKTMRSCLENITSLIHATWSTGFTANYHSTQAHDYLRCEAQASMSQRQLQFAVEFVFGTFLRVGPLLTARNNIIQEVHFTTAPKHTTEYENVFQCPIFFNKPFNQLVLPPTLVDQPLPSHCPPLELDALTALKEKFAEMTRGDDIISQVNNVLHQQSMGETHNIDSVANALNLSVRSLQRKLQNKNTTFSNIRIEFLIEQSKTLLRQSDLTMDAIADKLSFSDRAAFSRAFKRITGISPSLYRQQ